MLTVYLAGPIAGCTDTEATMWREEATGVLEMRGFRVLDPMVRDFRATPVTHALAHLIVGQDQKDIRRSDAVFAYCWKPGWGTPMEIMYAHLIGVPVVAVVPDDQPVSPWITAHASVFRTLHAGLRAV